MTLLIAAQDIRSVSLARVENGVAQAVATVPVGPERYLDAVRRTLEEWGVDPRRDVDAVAVVTGPGAFTSSRVSTVIANAMAFAADVPVIAVENARGAPVEELARTLPPPSAGFAQPVYNRPPNITLANKRA